MDEAQPKFQDIPATVDMAREELASLDVWFSDLQARLNEREPRAARIGFLNGYVAASVQWAAQMTREMELSKEANSGGGSD